MKVIFRYRKVGLARFLSPLETAKAIERNLRRAGIPLEMSQGFHPTPLISHLDSISTGVAIRSLYFSARVKDWNKGMMKKLKDTAVSGLWPEEFWVVEVDINRLVGGYEFSVIMEKEAIDVSKIGSGLRVKKGKKRIEHELRELVEDFVVFDLKRFMVLKYTLKREKLFSPWEIVKGLMVREGVFVPICEEAFSDGKPLRVVLEGMKSG